MKRMNTFAAASYVVVFALSTIGAGAVAHAGVINEPPPGNIFDGYLDYVAENEPQYGDVYSGVAQSFLAEDSHIDFGFYGGNIFTGSSEVTYSLYAGAGNFTDPLAQRTVTFPALLPSDEYTLVQADFSNVNLTPGDTYTVAATLPSGSLPPIGTDSSAGIAFNSIVSGYPGGEFYLLGLVDPGISNPNPGNPDEALAFEVTPVSSAPEPSTWALMIAGIGMVGGMMRYRARAALRAVAAT